MRYEEYDHTPQWIVHFDDLPSSAVAMYNRGGVRQMPSAPTEAPPATSDPGRSAAGGSTVLIVFSPDASRVLDMRIFPTSSTTP
jgi:hypothetical protein